MGKISPVSAKYIVHAHIQIEGVVEKPDIIGAVFGQTEGLLGSDLELRELQRSGRIGRIEVKSDIKNGKTDGIITIPSSLDKTETAIIAAAMETIQRIGPCNATVVIQKIEDIRISKRTYVINRAKELLKNLTNDVLPDSQEITDEVANSVRMMAIVEYGKDRMPAGPGIDDADEIIVVEGRADVLNLLKNGFKNAIALGGTGVPPGIIELSKEKILTLFVDGDRGGDLIIKGLMEVAEVDFVCKAPDGKEVEEITKKEIHKALRNKFAAEQAKADIKELPKRISPIARTNSTVKRPYTSTTNGTRPAVRATPAIKPRAPVKREIVSAENKIKFKELLDDLFGTRGAYILDTQLNILGKVPVTEIVGTIKNLKQGVFAVILDGTITKDITANAASVGVKYVVANKSDVRPTETRVFILTSKDL
ncbi:MAG: DNA primase DnaG [archaeon]